MDTLKTVFETIANPATAQAIETPKGKFIFNKILEETGAVSELELSQIPSNPIQPPVGGSTPTVNQPTSTSNGNQASIPA